MRILIVTTDFLPNVSGIATLSFEQAHSLARLGHDVRVITTTTGAGKRDGNGSFEICEYRNSQPPIIRLGRFFQIMADALRHWKPDFLWCSNYRGFGLPVSIAAIKRKIPYGIYIHGTELITENKSKVRSRIFRHVAGKANVICTNSCHTSTLLQSLFGLQSTPVTPGVDASPLETPEFMNKALDIRRAWLNQKPANCDESERVVFISSCRISKEKGIDKVLESLALLDPSLREKILYVVGGSGPDEAEFRALANNLGVEGQVLFSGFAKREDLAAVLKAADVYLQPSQPHGDYLEGFGISFLEAQAAGLPCIASDWCGIPEAIQKDVTGILIPHSSTEAIANAIKHVISDQHWRENAGREGVRWAALNNWSIHAEKLESLLVPSASTAAHSSEPN